MSYHIILRQIILSYIMPYYAILYYVRLSYSGAGALPACLSMCQSCLNIYEHYLSEIAALLRRPRLS